MSKKSGELAKALNTPRARPKGTAQGWVSKRSLEAQDEVLKNVHVQVSERHYIALKQDALNMGASMADVIRGILRKQYGN